MYIANSASESAEIDASLPTPEDETLTDASTTALISNFVSDLLLQYPVLMSIKVFLGRMAMVSDMGSDVILILSLFANDADYSSEAFTLMAVLFVPYLTMAISMYPVQPIITLTDGVTFARIDRFFPKETYGAFSSVLCVVYTLFLCIPKYILCDIVLVTYYSTVDLDCESKFDLLMHFWHAREL